MPKSDINLNYAIGLPPEKAIKYFESKGNKITWDWREQLQMNNHLAFTVAKVAQMDILQDMRKGISRALKDGITFDKFKKELLPRLAAKGWAPKMERLPNGRIKQLGAPYRLKIIYETNMQSAYNAGRWQSFEANKNRRQILEYVAIVDGSTRASHLELNGQRRPVDDPFWAAYAPPNGYRCRCRLRALTNIQADRRGGLSKGKPRGKNGKIIRPDKGFSGNPGTKNWQPDRKDYDADIWKAGKMLKPPPPVKPTQAGDVAKKYQPQKTVKAAEKWATDNNLADTVRYKGLDVGTANAINESAFNHLSRYPQIRKQMKFLGSNQERQRHFIKANLDKEYARWKEKLERLGIKKSESQMMKDAKGFLRRIIGRSSGEYALASAGRSGYEGAAGISVNSKFGKNSKTFLESLQRDTKSGWHPPGTDSIKAVVDHEFGHIIDYRLNFRKLPSFTGYYSGLTTKQIKDGLSKYGVDGGAPETIAEGWAEYINNKKARSIADKIGRIMEKELKNTKG